MQEGTERKRETEGKKKCEKKKGAHERKGKRENGQGGRVIEMRDRGAGGAKQRQTAVVGGVNQ